MDILNIKAINTYARGTERFIHTRTFNHPSGSVLFIGKYQSPSFHTHDVTINERKLVSKGWRLLEKNENAAIRTIREDIDMIEGVPGFLGVSTVVGMMRKHLALLEKDL